MIHKEAWYRELVAIYGEPDLNDPDSLYPYLQEPYAYSVGYDLEAMTDPHTGKWETVRHGPLAQGDFTEGIIQRLGEMSHVMWYQIEREGQNPSLLGPGESPSYSTWQLNIEGKWPFGPGEWDLFGLTSAEWESLADMHEDPYGEDPGIRAEIQFQVRPTGQFKEPKGRGDTPSERGDAESISGFFERPGR